MNTIVRFSAAWLSEPDKLQHILLSLIMVQVFSLGVSLPVAIWSSWFVGLLKEIWDWRYGSGFSRGDIVANSLGVSVGAALLLPLQAGF